MLKLLIVLAMSQAPATREEAAARYDRGVTLYQSNDYAGALAEFEAAYAATGRFEVLFNIGVSQRRLFRYGDAVDTLQRYLKLGGSKVPADKNAAVSKELAEMRALTAQVKLSVTPEDAVITIDSLNVKAGLVLVGSGHHVVEAHKDGFVTRREDIEVVSGKQIDLALVLVAQPLTATVDVVTTPPASIRVDDVPRGEAPVQLQLTPGGHLLLAEKDGFISARQEVLVTAGQRRSVSLQLDAIVKSPAWYQRWYIWTIIGVVIAGGTTAAVVATRRTPDVSLSYP